MLVDTLIFQKNNKLDVVKKYEDLFQKIFKSKSKSPTTKMEYLTNLNTDKKADDDYNFENIFNIR